MNNYTDGELHDINEQLAEREEVQYICYGKEEGQSGSPHLQGYLQLKDRKRLNKMLNFLETKGFTGRVSAPNQIEVLGTTALSNKEKREFKNPQGQWEADLKKGSSFLLQQTLQELGVKVAKKGEQV